MSLNHLPSHLTVIERGWLSSNSILIHDEYSSVLIDSGYSSHAQQTVSLVTRKLQGKSLNTIVNTHIHSDHCGGNSALQEIFKDVQIIIPSGVASIVNLWNYKRLGYSDLGQDCPRFIHHNVLTHGDTFQSGKITWEVYASPGHDPFSLIFYDPISRVLISADALWETGFGVVFPELEGHQAFNDVSETLDIIERLNPLIIIPGHGAPFTDLKKSLNYARAKLNYFSTTPSKHVVYASKVLIKFKLLDSQSAPLEELISWAVNTPYLQMIHKKNYPDITITDWILDLITQLVKSKAALIEGDRIINS